MKVVTNQPSRLKVCQVKFLQRHSNDSSRWRHWNSKPSR